MRIIIYEKDGAGGGLVDPATTIAELDNVVSWSAIPNEDLILLLKELTIMVQDTR